MNPIVKFLFYFYGQSSLMKKTKYSYQDKVIFCRKVVKEGNFLVLQINR